MLTEKQVRALQEALDSSHRPMFFFDDDTDGLSAFLQLYKRVGEGVGVIVQAKPTVAPRFAKKANDYGADKIFVLDVPLVDEDFVDACKAPIYWVDHHPLQEGKGISYFNPLANNPDENFPTSYCAWQVAGDKTLWLAMVGVTYDWVLRPELIEKFNKAYPDLAVGSPAHPGEVLYDTKVGRIIKIFQFSLKGPIKDVNAAIKVLTRIDDPHEILDASTPRARLLEKKFKKVNAEYERLMKGAKEQVSDDPLLIYTYTVDKYSLSSEVSNELIYRYPDKIIIVAREKDGYYRCSIRSAGSLRVRDLLEKAVEGLDARVGGHAQACGGLVAAKDFKQLAENLRQLL